MSGVRGRGGRGAGVGSEGTGERDCCRILEDIGELWETYHAVFNSRSFLVVNLCWLSA